MLPIRAHDRLFVLTGAGISAESGLPTFRGVGGLWKGHRVEDVASPLAWRHDPQMVWEFYSMRRRTAADKQPNPGHLALARLEQEIGERLFLCTQNVDDLHEKAGSQRVAHMHGKLFQSRCDTCDRPPFDDRQTYEDRVPRCPCGGGIRPHICWFGEVPFHLDAIYAALEDCTIFLAVGTSGVVHPAAGFVAHARSRRRRGQSIRAIYVGPEEPANLALFNESCLGAAGEVLPGLFALSPRLRVE